MERENDRLDYYASYYVKYFTCWENSLECLEWRCLNEIKAFLDPNCRLALVQQDTA